MTPGTSYGDIWNAITNEAIRKGKPNEKKMKSLKNDHWRSTNMILKGKNCLLLKSREMDLDWLKQLTIKFISFDYLASKTISFRLAIQCEDWLIELHFDRSDFGRICFGQNKRKKKNGIVCVIFVVLRRSSWERKKRKERVEKNQAIDNEINFHKTSIKINKFMPNNAVPCGTNDHLITGRKSPSKFTKWCLHQSTKATKEQAKKQIHSISDRISDPLCVVSI